MRRDDDLYDTASLSRITPVRLCPDVAPASSCIFGGFKATARLHPSAAMQSADIEAVQQWLDPDKHPVLLQMPEAEYK